MLPCPAEPHVILTAETMNHVGSSKIDWKRTAGSPARRRWLSAARGGTPPVAVPDPRAPAREWRRTARGGGGGGRGSARPGAPPRDLRLPVTNSQDPERIFPAERAASAQPRPPPRSRRRRPRPAPRPAARAAPRCPTRRSALPVGAGGCARPAAARRVRARH